MTDAYYCTVSSNNPYMRWLIQAKSQLNVFKKETFFGGDGDLKHFFLYLFMRRA